MKPYATGASNLCGEFCLSTSQMYYQRDGTSIKDNQESNFLNCFVKKQKLKKVPNNNIVAKYKNEDPVPKTLKVSSFCTNVYNLVCAIKSKFLE